MQLFLFLHLGCHSEQREESPQGSNRQHGSKGLFNQNRQSTRRYTSGFANS
jgi:hypothetical protein